MIGSSQNALQSGKSVTSLHHMAAKFLDQYEQFFLTETAIFHFYFERWKKSMSYRFVPECNHALEGHWSIFSFSLPYLQDHVQFVEIQKFATIMVARFILCWYKI